MRTNKIIGLILLLWLATPAMVTAQPFEGDMKTDGVFIRKGLKYETGLRMVDTMEIENPITGDVIRKTRLSVDLPASVNGKKVYGMSEVTQPAMQMVGTQLLEDYLMNELKESFVAGLDSVTVQMDVQHVLVDEKGKVLYYDLEAVQVYEADGSIRIAGPGNIPEKMAKLMADLPALKPAERNGMPVAAYVDIKLHSYRVNIRRPKVTVERMPYRVYGRHHAPVPMATH